MRTPFGYEKDRRKSVLFFILKRTYVRGRPLHCIKV